MVRSMSVIGMWVGLVVLGVALGIAQETRYPVREVVIVGNKALTKREIYEALPFNIGSRITLEEIERGAQALRELGTLEKVESDYRILKNGIRVIYRVVENPIVKKIEFTGNETYQFYLIDVWGIKLFPYKMKLARRDELIDALREAKVEENKPLNIKWFDDKIIENTITQFYLKKGYTFIGVDAAFNRDKQILTIQIVEGKLDAVEIRGLHEVPQAEIKELLQLPVGEPVRIAPIQEGIKAINRSVYFQQADESTIGVEPGSKPNSVKIIWNLKERRILDEPAEIRTIKLTGATVYPLARLQELIGQLPQGPINNYELLKALKRVYDLYRIDGYILVNFVKESLADGVLTLRVTEGKIVRVTISNACRPGAKSVIIPNLLEFPRQCTSELVIRKALRLKEGDFVNENPLRDSFRNLLQLGYFKQDGVNVQPKILDATTGEVELVVSVVEEDQLGNLKGGLSYNPQVGLVGQISLGWKNILGTAQDIDLSVDRGLVVRKDVLNYSLNYKTTAYFKEYNSVEISLFNNTQQQSEPHPHEMTKTGATFALSYPVRSDLTLTLRLRYENVWKAEPINEKSRIASVGMDIVHDTRNNPLFPTAGGELILMGEQAGKFAVVDAEFSKLQAIWTRHWLTFGRQTLSVRLYGAVGLTLPSQERFGFGGVMTVRGWETRFTDQFTLMNLEYRLELAENVWGAFYYDTGWAKEVGWRQALGFELRLITGFIGNVRLIIAWPFYETGLQIAPVFQFGFGTMF
ncbi:MAG: BamA/TamA family outer membrane protein [Candidatus Bipolaricaulota bacterium]|nr:BamA/TamA family outer membrane protein [Candidatus Bipolaricaulota bacterium]MDW8031452.1 POTRA domain-containing protein [Candidatus Bipolaricaulota bacterium]